MNILEKEYHHLSLWYFVSFFFGIIFFFQFIPNHSIYINICILLGLFIPVILSYRKNLLLFFLSSCLLAFVVGVLVSNIRMYSVTTNPIKKQVTTEIVGKIDNIKPTLRGMQITLVNVDLGDKRHLNKVRVNIASHLIEQASYGDIIEIKAKLFPLQSSVLPSTYDFGFYMYMSGIEASGYALGKLKIIESNTGFFHKYIQTIRRNIYKRLTEVLGTKKGNFAAAILIGEIKAIPEEIADNMRNSGVAHILSVSGLHLSLVAMIFFVTSRALLNCSNYLAYNTNIKMLAASISIVGSFLYLQISGSNIAATRAFIMTVIFIISIILGRMVYPLRSVMIAAFLILIFFPEYVFHPSFQLSFAAVLCLISGYEFYLRHKYILGGSKGIFASIKFYLYANIYSSLIASIITAPFVIYHFYKFASYSVPMNLVAVPLMSFLMMPLALLSVLLMPFALDVFTLKLLGFCITIITELASYIVNLPGSIWITGHISPLSLVIFTFGFFWLCLWQTTWRLIGFIIMACSLIMMFLGKNPDFIYDHSIKVVGVQDHNQKLLIYTQNNLSQFILNYWASWYGQEKLNISNKKIVATDQLFTLPSGKTISLNYWQCSDADLQIITSKRLKCISNKQIIPNDDIWKYRQVLIYCDKGKDCTVKYGAPKQW